MLIILIYLFFIIGILAYIISCFYLIWLWFNNLILKAKKNEQLKNNILSCIYFMMDMGANVSSVAVVAIIIVPKGVAIYQLILVFFLGIILKRMGRWFKSLFYKKLGGV